MKFNLNIFIFIFLSNLIYAQQIKYTPIFINQCTGQQTEQPWWISDFENNNYYKTDYSDNFIFLSKSGIYKLHLELFGEPEIIIVKNEKEIIDTFYTKRIELRQYVSNPPFSEYFDCDSLANGLITDYYYNGNIRIKGIFKNGQPIDTLKEYYRTGEISEIFIPFEKHIKEITYFKNGQIKTDYNSEKKYEKEYYQNEQIAKETFWNKKNISINEFYENGNIKLKINNKFKKEYSINGTLIQEIKRKEILIFNRIFSKGNGKFYEYNWCFYNTNGVIEKELIFNESGFLMNNFPDSIEQIKEYLFSKILFYKEGVLYKKIENKPIKENNKFVDKFVIYRKKNNEWIEEGIIDYDNLYYKINNP